MLASVEKKRVQVLSYKKLNSRANLRAKIGHWFFSNEKTSFCTNLSLFFLFVTCLYLYFKMSSKLFMVKRIISVKNRNSSKFDEKKGHKRLEDQQKI